MPSSDLTESDRRFLEVAITCLKEPPQLDVPKIAEKLGIKNKSVTNKWWEIKKKLWGVEAARAAGEKTRQMATAAGVKRKREETAGNPDHPLPTSSPTKTKPVKEKPRWYPDAPAAAAPPTGFSTSTTGTGSAAGIVPGDYAAQSHDDAANPWATSVADLTMTAATGPTTMPTTTPPMMTTAVKLEHMDGEDDARDFGRGEHHEEVRQHSSNISNHGEDAGVV